MNKQTEELLLNSTSIIYTVDRHNNRRKATCFFVHRIKDNKKEHFLVTNKHVLNGKISIELHLDFYNKLTKTYSYDNKVLITLGNDVHFHSTYDLAAFSLKFLDSADTDERTYSYSSIGIGMIPNDFNISYAGISRWTL